jgi:zinc protease
VPGVVARGVRALFLAQLLGAAPAAPSVQRYTLPNGLRVLLREDHSTSLCAVYLAVRVGSASEESGQGGVAGLIARLLSAGTRRVPDGMAERLIAEAGGTRAASVSEDRTGWSATLPSASLDLALWIEGDRLSSTLDDVDQERLDRARGTASDQVESALREALYPEGHPYRRTVGGAPEEVRAVSPAEARAFFRRFYVPGNTTLALAGDLPPDVRDRVDRYLGGLARGPVVLPPAAPPVRLTDERRVEVHDRVTSPRVWLVWPSPAAQAPGDAELHLLADVLAGGPSSRLYGRLVRERPVAWKFEAAQVSARLGSTFRVGATVRPGQNPRDLVQRIDGEIARLRASPPEEPELRRARVRALSRVYRAMDRLGGVAELMNRCADSTGPPDPLEQEIDRPRQASPGDLRRVASEVLGPGRIVLLVLPP